MDITPEVVNTVQLLRYEIAHPGSTLTADDLRSAVRRLDEAGLFAPVDHWLTDLTSRITGQKER